MSMWFSNRHDAGRQLAKQLMEYAVRPGVIVLGLARGGVPVACEVARRLGVPLDVFVVRKLGVPGYEETAMGAIASGEVCVLNESLIADIGLTRAAVDHVRSGEQLELERREIAYRGSRPPVDVHGSTVIVVDDGLATGATMKAAVSALRKRGAARVVVAVPVASPQACVELSSEVDRCVCVLTPPDFYGVGVWYEDFTQTTDDTVRSLLIHAAALLPEDARHATARSHLTQEMRGHEV